MRLLISLVLTINIFFLLPTVGSTTVELDSDADGALDKLRGGTGTTDGSLSISTSKSLSFEDGGITGFEFFGDIGRVTTAPVTVLRATGANSSMTLDLWPSTVNGGTPANAFEGNVKIDLVDRDLSASDDPTQFQALLLSINSAAARIGTHSGGSTLSPVPLTFWGPNTGAAFTFTTTGPGESNQHPRYQMTDNAFGDTDGNFMLWGGGTGLTGQVHAASPIHLKDNVQLNWWDSSVGLTSYDSGIARAAAGIVKITNGLTGMGGLQAAGGSANHAVCWKADGKTLGYCSAVVAADGTCGTCN